jgi:hypothetical protein
MSAKTTHIAFAIAVVLSAAAPSASQADDCQAKLATALSKIMSSGPMRWTTKVITNGKPNYENILEFVPPTDTRLITRTLVQGEEFIKQKAMLEKRIGGKLDANGFTEAYTDIGADSYIGTKKDNISYDERLEKKPGELIYFLPFSHSEIYFAKSCSSNKIDYEFNPLAGGKDPFLDEDKALGFVRSVLTGTVELDATGRPVRLVRGDLFPGPAQLAIMRQANPGAEWPVITSQSIEMSFTYDPALKIEVPK